MKTLLVEDYQPLQKSISKAIRETGWAVDVASDGEEGHWHIENHTYDVIILDLMLPKMNGLEVLHDMREKGNQTPVLILTSRDAVQERMKGLDLGADDYLVKPCFMGELLSRINALVRRSYGQKDPLLRVGDLEVNTSSRSVRRGETEVDLSAREYALLEYLARRQGDVVTRTDIWEHVYESYCGASSNVVDVYVGYLRKKLHLPNKPPIIHTKRGQGYVLKNGS